VAEQEAGYREAEMYKFLERTRTLTGWEVAKEARGGGLGKLSYSDLLRHCIVWGVGGSGRITGR
jgi:hypothetical protein